MDHNEMTEARLSDLLIATGNNGKLLEIRALLGDLPLRLQSLKDFPHTVEVEETGATFAENALLKAREYALQTAAWTLADDSGLEVDALSGAPGVLSARYAGETASDVDRINLLLSELARTGDAQRRARFVCVVAVADRAGRILNVSEGMCEGHVAHAPRGLQGFGYDPIFIPDGHAETFGELTSEIKDSISHRGRAIREAREFLLKLSGRAG